MNSFHRDDFMKAYPFDIAFGILLGGVICVIAGDYYNWVIQLIGVFAFIVGSGYFLYLAMGFNGGTHAKRW